jgi:glycosyltransferase involved in cell wall biosynthesis
MLKSKVCHITTVHALLDPRIFRKELGSLVKTGYDVGLIAQHDKNEIIDGVHVVALPKATSRLHRVMTLPIKALWLAIGLKADIYHFHDPELIPIGVVLRLLGKIVIYDVHEDYVTAMGVKDYMPKWLRKLMAFFIKVPERISRLFFTIVLAERYYKERFPQGEVLRNYPLLADMRAVQKRCDNMTDSLCRLIYTGNLTGDRGASIYAAIPQLGKDIEVYCVGNCPSKLAKEMADIAGSSSARLHIEGIDTHVPFSRILEYYGKHDWFAALAIFLPNPHSLRKELTKFYEYMMMGLPIIASNFPVWKSLIEKNCCGICVDPLNMNEIREAIDFLRQNPDVRKQMGGNGKRLAMEQYNWETESKKLLQLYEKLCINGQRQRDFGGVSL